VIAGARGWRDQEIFETVRDLRLYDALTFLGSVSREELHWLYNACTFYANPSLYEGFGLPVLEALACGAACIVSQSSSLPEVAGQAALLLPPLEVEAWAAAFARLWHDEQERASLAQRGPAQAARFSWQRAARETLAIYRRIQQAYRA
jgi:glycosyltransferase involved in cell wall biosynthesis